MLLGAYWVYLCLLKAYWCLFVLIECLYNQLSCLLGLIRAYCRAIFSKIGSHKRQHIPCPFGFLRVSAEPLWARVGCRGLPGFEVQSLSVLKVSVSRPHVLETSATRAQNYRFIVSNLTVDARVLRDRAPNHGTRAQNLRPHFGGVTR